MERAIGSAFLIDAVALPQIFKFLKLRDLEEKEI
jgi:hypothetical protein